MKTVNHGQFFVLIIETQISFGNENQEAEFFFDLV